MLLLVNQHQPPASRLLSPRSNTDVLCLRVCRSDAAGGAISWVIPAPLKLRPYGAIQICLLLLLFFYTPGSKVLLLLLLLLLL